MLFFLDISSLIFNFYYFSHIASQWSWIHVLAATAKISRRFCILFIAFVCILEVKQIGELRQC